MKDVIYLTDAEINEILVDMDVVKKSNDWSEVDKIYDKYSNRFAEPLVEYFGEDYVVDLEHNIFDSEFDMCIYGFKDPEDGIRKTLNDWPKYLILGGLAHWIYLKMEKLEK
nr:MAG TPA: hypothetical protein [Caudoviricetes sp.]